MEKKPITKVVELRCHPQLVKNFLTCADENQDYADEEFNAWAQINMRSAIRTLFHDPVFIADLSKPITENTLKHIYPVPKSFKLKLVLEVD